MGSGIALCDIKIRMPAFQDSLLQCNFLPLHVSYLDGKVELDEILGMNLQLAQKKPVLGLIDIMVVYKQYMNISFDIMEYFLSETGFSCYL